METEILNETLNDVENEIVVFIQAASLAGFNPETLNDTLAI